VDKELLIKEASNYQQLENLTNQEGWKILLSQLNKLKTADMLDLLKEKKYDDILALQGRIAAFNSVINILSSAKLIKEKLFNDVVIIMEEEKLMEEYDL
jgi:hypothetical protein